MAVRQRPGRISGSAQLRRTHLFAISAAVPECPRVTIVDVGAIDLGDSRDLPWQALVDAGLAQVACSQCQRLNYIVRLPGR